MRKRSLIVFFFLISTKILMANAQTVNTSGTGQQNPSLIGELIATVVVVAVFSIIIYAGYKVVKKWSSSQFD